MTDWLIAAHYTTLIWVAGQVGLPVLLDAWKRWSRG